VRNVQTAKALERRGWVTLQRAGSVKRDGHAVEGSRATITDVGHEQVPARRRAALDARRARFEEQMRS
jgi:hypothetical protein